MNNREAFLNQQSFPNLSSKILVASGDCQNRILSLDFNRFSQNDGNLLQDLTILVGTSSALPIFPKRVSSFSLAFRCSGFIRRASEKW